MESPASWRRLRKIRRCLVQYLGRLWKLPVLSLEGRQLRGNVRRYAAPLAGIDLGLLHPLVQRLPRAADFGGDREDRPPARRMFMRVIQNQPYCALAHFRGETTR